MEMRNILLLASALTLLPAGASAQFYTVTQGKEMLLQHESKTPLSAENKRDTAIVSNETLSIDTLANQDTEEAADRTRVQKSNGKPYLDEGKNASEEKVLSVERPSIGKPAAKAKATAKPADTADCNLPALTIPNLYAEIKRTGILYPDIVLAQAILETGWFRSNACRKKHNLFGLTNPRTGKYYEFDHWTESVRAYYTKVQYRYKGGNKEREHGVCFVLPNSRPSPRNPAPSLH